MGGASEAAEDHIGDGAFAESGDEAVEGGGGEVGFVADGVEGFPAGRGHFLAEGFEAVEVVEASAVGAGPGHEAAEPDGVVADFVAGVLGEGDEAHGDVVVAAFGEAVHEGVDKEFGGAVGSGGGADDLFDEEAFSLRDGGGEEEGDGGGGALCDEEETVGEFTAEGLGFDEEMHFGEGACGDPFAEAAFEGFVGSQGVGILLMDDDAFVAGAGELGAEGAALLDDAVPVARRPDGLGADGDAGVMGGVGEELGEAFRGADVADATSGGAGGGFEFGCDFGELGGVADGGAGDDPGVAAADVADDGVGARGEPMVDSGVQDLVGGGVPAVGEN